MMVSVNLSAAQLRDNDIVPSVRAALDEADIPPPALMIEVTEGALIGDVAGARTVLESLHDLGVTIAIDDFGTGYSSLSHLQQFPVDVIKIDKSFVDGLCRGNDEATLVRSVLAIGAEFGLQVVAEGIQAAEQDEELRRLGCDYGQGYLYAPAMPARQLDEMLGLERALEVLGGAGQRAVGPGGESDPLPDAAQTMAAVAETIASAARCRGLVGHPGPTSGAGLHEAAAQPTRPDGSRRSA
jgi:EAL domain-containing protein (putative c-di-GMP-specific phosphodiesterase class I)